MRRTFLAATLAAFLVAPAANAAIVEQFKVADWDAAAFTADDTGQFSHCSVYAEYQNGATLYISSETDGAWYLSVSNPKWQLTAGGQFAIRFRIDRRDTVEGTTVAIGTDQVGLPVEANNPFIGQLRRGSRLVMTFQNTDYAFELSNSNKAMDAAQECVRRHLALGTHTPVMSQQGTPPPSQEQPQAADAGGDQPPSEAVTTGQPMPPPQEQPQAETQADSDRATVQASGEQQTFGQWVVTAATDQDGKFANCTAYNVQGDDQLIISQLPDNSWEFGFYRAAWKLDTNATYYLWYNVDAPADGAGVVKHPVEAAEATRLWFAVTADEDIIDRIEHGSTLNLQLHSLTGAAEDYSFALAEAPAAFDATRKCVADHAQPAESAEAPSKEGSGVKEPTEGGAAESQTPENQAVDNQPAESDTAAPVEHNELPVMGYKKIEDLTVPGWTAAAFSDDAGTFTHCGIKAEYQNGATFGVARAADGSMLLAVQHGEWSLTEGEWVPLSYTLTGGSEVATAGQVIGTNVIMANVGSEEALTTQIHDAHDLNITAEGKSLAFDISDIGPGIEEIDSCVERHTAAASEPTPAPAPAPAPASKKSEATPAPAPAESDVASADNSIADIAAPSPAPAPEAAQPEQQASTGDDAIDMQALEESFFTMGALMKAGYLGFQELPDDASIPAELPKGKTAWKLNGVTGVTVAYPGAAADEVKGMMATEQGSRCGNSPTPDVAASDDSGHVHFSLTCGSGADARTIHYVILPRDSGGSYLLAIVGGSDAAEAGAVAAKLYETSLKS